MKILISRDTQSPGSAFHFDGIESAGGRRGSRDFSRIVRGIRGIENALRIRPWEY
jgi:hypothetical protein